MAFFKKEFELDWKLANYSVGDQAWDGSKIYIALMNGLTMGGGAGLSFGGLIRVATEKTKFGACVRARALAALLRHSQAARLTLSSLPPAVQPCPRRSSATRPTSVRPTT